MSVTPQHITTMWPGRSRIAAALFRGRPSRRRFPKFGNRASICGPDCGQALDRADPTRQRQAAEGCAQRESSQPAGPPSLAGSNQHRLLVPTSITIRSISRRSIGHNVAPFRVVRIALGIAVVRLW
jgi:hypothetical protein